MSRQSLDGIEYSISLNIIIQSGCYSRAEDYSWLNGSVQTWHSHYYPN